MTILESSLIPRRNFYLFVDYPLLLWFRTLRGRVTILLTILTRQDQWSTLPLPLKWIDIGIVIRTSTIETISLRSIRIPGLTYHTLTRSSHDKLGHDICLHGLLWCLPPPIGGMHPEDRNNFILLFWYRVVNFLFRIDIINPSLG